MLLFTAAKKALSRESATLFLILVFAAFFRFYRLNDIPLGLHSDEAFNLSDVARLVDGQFAIFFPANNGREPLYLYLATLSVAIFGPQPFALRLTSAIIGTATIPLVYGFVRALFRSVRVAAFAALFTAISVWHIYFSRYGERIILSVPMVILSVWWLWEALKHARLRDYAFAGLFASLTAYTYTNGRLLPIILVSLTIFAVILNRTRTKAYLGGLGLAGAAAFGLFLPLGIYFLLNPDQLFTHTRNLSILDPRVNKGDIVGTTWGNLGAVAGMFLVRGDHEMFRNIPNRPVFDPVIGSLFVLGLAMLLVALLSPRSSKEERLRALLIAVSSFVFLSTSILSDDAPIFTRTIAALPFVMILPAWAAAALWTGLNRRLGGKVTAGVFGAVVLASSAITFRDYFVDFGNSPSLYYAFDGDRYDAAEWINRNSSHSHIFLAPLWYQHATVSFIARNAPLKSFDSRDTVILPGSAAGKDAVYLYPLEQEQRAEKLGERLGAMAVREQIIGSNGAPILITLRVPARFLPDLRDPMAALARGGSFVQPQKIERAVWENQMEWLGYTVDPEGPGGRNLVVTLFLHSREPMSEDYTFSIKVRDERDRVWGQEDKWLGDNSYATSQWGMGDVVIESFYPGLHPCAPAGDYRITVEAYSPATMQVLELTDRAGNVVSLGTAHAEASYSNRLEHLDPDQVIDADIAPQLHLLGLTLTPRQVRAGDAFSLSLYWRGQEGGSDALRPSIDLRDSSGRAVSLAETSITLPGEGRGVCTFLDLRVPPDVSPGAAPILVDNVKITSLEILR